MHDLNVHESQRLHRLRRSEIRFAWTERSNAKRIVCLYLDHVEHPESSLLRSVLLPCTSTFQSPGVHLIFDECLRGITRIAGNQKRRAACRSMEFLFNWDNGPVLRYFLV